MKFPPVDYSEMVSDASQRPPAFLNRMQDFKDELEEIKVHIKTYTYVIKSYKQNKNCLKI